MIKFVLKTLPLLCLGTYIGLRFEHWFGADMQQSLLDACVFLESSVHDLYLWVKSFVVSNVEEAVPS